MAFIVTIESTGGTQNIIVSEASTTIAQVLSKANINPAGLHIMVDNQVVNGGHVLTRTCTVQLRKNTTGNS